MSITLTPHNFMTSVTASTVGAWVPVDYRFCGIQQRTIVGSRETSASDEVIVEVKIEASAAGGNLITVIATATSWTGAGNTFSAVVQGGYNAIRIRKVGSSAAATVNGLI